MGIATPVDVAHRKAIDVLSRDEIASLTGPSDAMGAWAVASTWAVIAGALAVVARWPNALTVLGAIVVVGGRQLALAILMHEGAHRTLFRTRWLNDFAADWLAGRPIWTDLRRYRVHHLTHHTKTGTDEDTDISLSAPFPTTRASLARKVVRDLTGVTGIKGLYGRALMDAGILKWTVAQDIQRLPRGGRAWTDYVRDAARNMAPTVLTNAILFGVLAATGHPWLYAIWAGAYLTTFNLFMRIRSMAEHACTEKTTDSFRNTRTTRAGWLARMTVAPVRVNYHLEHHLLVAVPYFRLPAMHRLLRDRGTVAEPPGYLQVLDLVSSRGRAPSPTAAS
jgi:fatty acid desaturase